MKTRTLSLLAFLISAFNSFGNNPPVLSLGYVQSGFVENIGQIKDQNSKPNEKVKFIYADKFFHLELTNQGFSYEFFKVTNSSGKFPESGNDGLLTNESGNYSDEQIVSTRRVDVTLKNANPHFELLGEEASGVYYNYYLNALPGPGITNARSFGKVVYKNIYPGIDLVFTAPNDEEQLKYEFVIQPGSNSKLIQLNYHGADGMFINPEGNLQIETALGFVRECDLRCYYLPDKTEVPSNLVLKGNTVSFNLPVVMDQLLIIDPNLIYATYYGGEGMETVNNEIAVDKAGKAIIDGSTQSFTSIATTGAHQTTLAGFTDGCVAKFDVNGKILWATYFGGEAKDVAHGIVTDKSNNIFITGQTKSNVGIATSGAYHTARVGGMDGFVAKFNASGVIQWSTYIGGYTDEDLKNVICDKDGNVYVAGQTMSPNGVATPGAFQESFGGDEDMLLAKFTNGGQLLWATYYGGSLSDRAQGLAIDYQGNVIICASTASENGIASTGAWQPAYGGGVSDAVLAKFDGNGHRTWGTYYGGERDDHGRTPITDSGGNIFFTGFTTSTTGIATPGSFQQYWGASGGVPANDAVVAKFTSSGNRVWASYYGGDRNDEFYSVAIDPHANLYLAGASHTDSGMTTSDAFQPLLNSSSDDGLLVKMDSAGHRIYATYFGGPENEQIGDIAISKTGFLYFVVNTDGTMPCSPWVSQTQNNGSADLGAYKFYMGPGCFDYNEPNETLSAATSLTVVTDTTLYGYNGCISKSTDEDWFKFSVQTGMANFKIQLVDLTVDYDLQLLNTSGGVVKTSNNLGTANETIILNNAGKKKYDLHILHSSSEYDSLHCYRLLIFKSANPFKLEEGDEQLSDNKLVVSPNPASNCVHLSFNSTSSGQTSIIIYDLMMRPVMNSTVQVEAGKVNTEITLPDLSSGTYVVEVRKDGEVLRKKIMIQH
ncbi:MAG TPA: SBBP repeat-containing protein [Chitinophagales bacterium]|nr:SBBP repeat-containing protein [Chitinophagales bacterium]